MNININSVVRHPSSKNKMDIKFFCPRHLWRRVQALAQTRPEVTITEESPEHYIATGEKLWAGIFETILQQLQNTIRDELLNQPKPERTVDSFAATGIFNWNSAERRSDRYGMVGLWPSTYNEDAHVKVEIDADKVRSFNGCRVHMKAKVLANRNSGHCGDIMRGISPRRPRVGREFDLGTGTFQVDYCAETITYGLAPDDRRHTDWFDPKILYWLHDQTVELTFEIVP